VPRQELPQTQPPTQALNSAPRSLFVLMHPAVYIPAFTLLGLLFALQEWTNMGLEGYSVDPFLVFESWGLQYFLWGAITWLLWRVFRPFIRSVNAARMLTVVLPAGFIICLIEDMIWVACLPHLPLKHSGMGYWQRVAFNYKGDMAESLAIFWFAFFFVRGVGYYQELREKETMAAQLETQLANAKIAALRMQLNPHFLFNTMNSISSLMRSDIEGADSLLEQLSSLLRMTLERRDVQLIPLHDEIEFTETYLAMQDRRYTGRVTRTLEVEPDLYDALVPAMILQPIVENAYAHGLSKLERIGQLSIEVKKNGEQVCALITNTGPPLHNGRRDASNGHGMGLTNVRNRLRLHYGENCSFSISDLDRNRVQVKISFPLQLSATSDESTTRFGA
jgi:two-component system, LytTR family, sensor kinase